MTIRNSKCASCESFPTAALESDGVAVCAAFDKRTSWDWPACVLYDRAPDISRRTPMVKQLQQREAATDESVYFSQ